MSWRSSLDAAGGAYYSFDSLTRSLTTCGSATEPVTLLVWSKMKTFICVFAHWLSSEFLFIEFPVGQISKLAVSWILLLTEYCTFKTLQTWHALETAYSFIQRESIQDVTQPSFSHIKNLDRPSSPPSFVKETSDISLFFGRSIIHTHIPYTSRVFLHLQFNRG